MTDKLLGPRGAQLPARYPVGDVPDYDPIPYADVRQPSVVLQAWDMLRRRKWTVLAGLLSVLAVTAVVTYKLPRSYVSSLSILVGTGPRDAGMNNLAIVDQGPAIQTEMKLITSRRIVAPVVDENDLHVKLLAPAAKRPADVLPGFEAGREAVAGTYSLTQLPAGGYEFRRTDVDSLLAKLNPGQTYASRGLRFQLPQKLTPTSIQLQVTGFEGAVGATLGQLGVWLADPDATLIGVSCSAGGAAMAQRICDGVSKSYVALRNDLARSDATHSAAFLAQQSDTVGLQLAVAEEQLRSYQESNDVVDPRGLASQESGEIAQFQTQRDQLESERRALAAFIGQLGTGEGSEKYRDLAAFPTFINNPMVGNILSNLVTYENQLHELSTRRTDANQDVIDLKRRISELEGQLGQLATNYESALTGQVASLDKTLGTSRGRLSSVPKKQMEVERLERKTQLLSQIYTTLQQKLKEAQITEAVELADVQIIDPASLPGLPSFPNVKLNLALGLVAGLLVGLGGAILQEFADTRVRRRSEVEQETGLPVLTMIPSVKGGRFIVGRPRKLLAGAAAGSEKRLGDYYPSGGEVVVEAFRALGADLGYMVQGTPERDTKIIVFTSPSRGEGKTFSAVNFAATRALEGYRTLLIDADLRAGGAGAALGLDHAPGLGDVLAGEAQLLDVIRMVKVGRHRLAVVGAGTGRREGRSVGSEELDAVLTAAAQHFDQVVVDTPPINLVSDAALLASRAHAVIVVVRSGRTDREALELTLSRLSRLGAKPLGIVLNDVKLNTDYAAPARYEPAAREAAG